MPFADWREVLEIATRLVRTRALFVPIDVALVEGVCADVSLLMPDGMRLFLAGTVASVARSTLSGATIIIDKKYATDLVLLEQLALAAKD